MGCFFLLLDNIFEFSANLGLSNDEKIQLLFYFLRHRMFNNYVCVELKRFARFVIRNVLQRHFYFTRNHAQLRPTQSINQSLFNPAVVCNNAVGRGKRDRWTEQKDSMIAAAKTALKT